MVETALFGDEFKKEIHYAALTLDGRALSSYGECFVLLRDSMIAHRASVFEENSLLFMKRHDIKLFEVDRLPQGYRATWADRGKLPVAKLAARIDSRTRSNQFPGLLMRTASKRTNDDFVEVHLFGPLTAFTFEKVVRNTLTAWARNIQELWEQDRPQRHENHGLRTSGSAERGEERPRHVKEKRRKSYNREQAKLNVDSQKELVVELLKGRKFAQARRVIDEVVAYNLEHGGREYACKTLCSLAKAAQDQGLCSLQLDLTERSIALDRDDGWSWTQHGKALLDAGRPADALRAYDRALELTGDVEAKTGRAEVLKAQGKLSEALSAYEQVIREHPEDLVAKNGRAEVLKAQGKLSEALSAFEQVIRKHPENVVAKTGRTCVLVETGRWDEALLDLPTLSDRHQQNWVGLHIRGMILLKTGQLPAAREIFEVGLAEYPFATGVDYFRTGLCLVDMAERRYAAAAKALAQVRVPALQRPAVLLRVHALGADQQYSDAARIYKIAAEPASELEREIKTELTFRYVDRSGPQHDDEWLLEREVRWLLAA